MHCHKVGSRFLKGLHPAKHRLDAFLTALDHVDHLGIFRGDGLELGHPLGGADQDDLVNLLAGLKCRDAVRDERLTA